MAWRAQLGRGGAHGATLRRLGARLMLLLLLTVSLGFHAHGLPGGDAVLGVTLQAIDDRGDCAPTIGHGLSGCPATARCVSMHACCSTLHIAPALIHPLAQAGNVPSGRLAMAALAITPPTPPPIGSSER